MNVLHRIRPMPNAKLPALALGLLALTAPLALTQGTGAQGYLTIHNDTSGKAVVGFYISQGSAWSDNRLIVDVLLPGESAEALFYADIGACDRAFALEWRSEETARGAMGAPVAINICDASHVYLDDEGIHHD